MAAAVAPGVLAEGLEELRAQLRGDVITGSGGEGAGRVRAVFNAMHVGTPAVTVRPTGTADVVDAVQFARKQGLKLGVRGGGHSIAGLSALDGGLLLDLSAMDGVVVDPGRKLVTAQGRAAR